MKHDEDTEAMKTANAIGKFRFAGLSFECADDSLLFETGVFTGR